jgi:hypothetical protein
VSASYGRQRRPGRTRIPGALLAAPGDYQSIVLADSPVAFWPMQDTSGDLVDIAGTFDASPAGSGHSYEQTGPSATVKAVTLDGSNSFTVADDDVFSPDSFTLETWLYFSSSGIRWAMSKRPNSSSGSYEYHLLWVSDVWALEMGTGSASFLEVIASDANPYDRWRHVVGTYDDATGTGNLYIDGVLGGTDTSSGSRVGNTAATLQIGAQLSTSFTGSMSMTAFYDYALTGAQVATHHAAM